MLNQMTEPDIHQAEVEKSSRIGIVAIAGSAGGVDAVRQILACLPADFPAPIVYVQHLNGSYCSALEDILQSQTVLKVRWAQQGARLKAGVVYLCPGGFSLLARPDRTLALAPAATHREVLHGADRLFASVAASYGHRAVVVVLSGAGWDGSDGVCAVRAQHGTVLVQDEASAFQWSMPRAALETGCVDMVLRLKDMTPVIVNLVRDGYRLSSLRASVARFVEPSFMPLSPALQGELDRLLTIVLRMDNTDLGNIQLLERETGNLTIVAQHGFGLDFLEHFAKVSMEDESACARAMRAREPVLISDVTTDPLFAAHRDVAASAEFRAVLSTPLIKPDGSLLGVLSTHFRTPQPLSQVGLPGLDRIAARRASDLIQRFNVSEH
jgi:hypothetical protein